MILWIISLDVSCAKIPGSLKLYRLYICDPLSENPAHPVFHENGNKTRNWYIDVQLFSRTKMKAIGCLVPELQTEKHLRHGTQFF